MSTLAKIFIVLNMLVGVAFAFASLTLYSKRIHWAEQTQKAMAESDRLYEAWQKLNTKYIEYQGKMEKDKVALEKEVNNLSEQLNEQTQDNQTLQETNDRLVKDIDRINDRLSDLRAQIEEKEKRNRDLQEAIDKEIQRASDFKQAKEHAETRVIEVMADLREAENEMMNLAQSNAQMLKKIAIQANMIDKYVSIVGPDPTVKMVGDEVVPIRGRVVKVSEEYKLVILDVGEKDKVKQGMEFIVSRGAQYIGKVRIRKVYPKLSSATFVKGMMEQVPQPADLAQLDN